MADGQPRLHEQVTRAWDPAWRRVCALCAAAKVVEVVIVGCGCGCGCDDVGGVRGVDGVGVGAGSGGGGDDDGCVVVMSG